MDVILNRRSIREYQDKLIPEAVIQDLLRAAMQAPSAGNEQPWQFVVINDQDKLDLIPTVHPHAHMLLKAPLAILVCADISLDLYDGAYWYQDCAAATENLLLAATVKRLGSVWLGVYPDQNRMQGLKNLFNLPEQIIPFSLVSLGFPTEIKKPAARFDKDRIHYNNW